MSLLCFLQILIRFFFKIMNSNEIIFGINPKIKAVLKG